MKKPIITLIVLSTAGWFIWVYKDNIIEILKIVAYVILFYILKFMLAPDKK